MMIAPTPAPPYYAVIFTSVRSDGDQEAYSAMAGLMEELASQQPGYLGVESARNEIGITVSYWSDIASIKQWKANVKHQAAQRLGKEKWYEAYTVRICKVEMAYTDDPH
ncbi:antibiotic biosynthesis monooxygenase [Ostertagia ostertagi]